MISYGSQSFLFRVRKLSLRIEIIKKDFRQFTRLVITIEKLFNPQHEFDNVAIVKRVDENILCK